MRGRARVSALALLVCFGLAGCGTTVDLKSGNANAGGTSSRPGDSLSVVNGPATGGASGTQPGAVTSTGTTGSLPSGGQVGGTTNASSSGAPAAPVGVTATAINVGIPYNPSANQQLASLGFSALAGGDVKQYFSIVINDQNKHGGILGHQINPIYDTISNDPNKTQAQGDQEECSYFTEDHKVYATFLAGTDDTSRRCLTNGHVSVMLTENLTTSTAAVFQRYPNYIEMSTLDYDHTADPWVASLVRQHYFDGWDPTTGAAVKGKPAKIGIITSDEPGIRRSTQQSLLPALARAGHPVDPDLVAYITFPQTTNDDATAINDVQNAELKFFQSGVTHVIINDYAAGFTAFFTRDADSQHYHPRYGLSSQSGAQTLYSSGVIPKGQLNGAIGLGWDPALDLQASDNPDNGPYSNDTRRACLALFQKNGVTFGGSPTAEAQALAICDMVWGLRAILTAAGAPLTTNTYAVGVQRVGRSFTAATTLGSFLTPDHRAAVGAAADWSYASSCDCMRYVSRPYQVGS